ncbi:hypothetical protein D3C83_127930 [compost metagenome]
MPNSRSDSETGFAISDTPSSAKLNGTAAQWLKGCRMSSLVKPQPPLILTL